MQLSVGRNTVISYQQHCDNACGHEITSATCQYGACTVCCIQRANTCHSVK